MSYKIAALALCIFATVAAKPCRETRDTSNQDGPMCLVNGQVLKLDEKATSGRFVFKCQRTESNTVRATIVACTDETKAEHPIGDSWVQGERPFRYVFKCEKSGSMTEIKVVQCFYDGDDGQAKLDPGQQQKIGKALVRCDSIEGGGVQFRTVYDVSAVSSTNTGTSNANTGTGSTGTGSSNANTASNTNTNTNSGTGSTNTNTGSSSSTSNQSPPTCSVNGQELKQGEKATSGRFVYECQATENKSVRAVIVACMDDGSDGKAKAEVPIGQRFVKGGEGPYRYIFECTKSGSVTSIRGVQCFYDGDDGQAKLDIGQQQRIGKKIVGCDRMGENGIQFHLTHDAPEVTFNNGTSTGSSSSTDSNVNTASLQNNDRHMC